MQRALIALTATILLIGCGVTGETVEPPATTEAPATTVTPAIPRVTVHFDEDPTGGGLACMSLRIARGARDNPGGDTPGQYLDNIEPDVISTYDLERMLTHPELLDQALEDCDAQGFTGP